MTAFESSSDGSSRRRATMGARMAMPFSPLRTKRPSVRHVWKPATRVAVGHCAMIKHHADSRIMPTTFSAGVEVRGAEVLVAYVVAHGLQRCAYQRVNLALRKREAEFPDRIGSARWNPCGPRGIVIAVSARSISAHRSKTDGRPK